MDIDDSEMRKAPVPYRFDVRRSISVRRINIVLILVAFSLLVMNAGQLDRRVRFWWTGKVKIDGLTFYLNPDDTYLTQIILTSGTYELEETRLFRNKCRPGDNIIDVGANVGWYTVIASKLVGKKGRVIAFEPDPENFAILTRNIYVNRCDNVILEQKAVSNAAGTLTLYLDDVNKGKHSTVFDLKGKRAIEVQAVRLDDYLEDRLKRVDLVKIDVEGAEPMVLEGMQRTLQSNAEVRLVVEFAPERVLAVGRQPKQYLDGLINQGFSIYDIDEKNRRVVMTTPAEILAQFRGERRGRYTNLFLQRGSD